MKPLKLLLLLLLIGCGPVPSVPEDLRPLVDQFLADAERHGIVLHQRPEAGVIRKAKLAGTEHGICSRRFRALNTGPRFVITIEENLPPGFYLKTVVYHELGHCLLLLPHSDNSDDIMAPTTIHLRPDAWEASVQRMMRTAGLPGR
jgi:hypothetical protein